MISGTSSHSKCTRCAWFLAAALVSAPAFSQAAPAKLGSKANYGGAKTAAINSNAQKLVLDDFERSTLDWSDGNEKDGKSDYFIQSEGGARFLRGQFIPKTDGKVVYRKVTWNTKEYPWLAWRWRINRFPTGSKIMIDGKRDSAAQVYIVWKLKGRRYSLKYVWTESDIVGTGWHEGKWNPFGRYFGLVIRSGGETGEWTNEIRNVQEEFRKAFDKEPPEETEGIGVLTDGDGTNTEPQGDYDDFTAWTHMP